MSRWSVVFLLLAGCHRKVHGDGYKMEQVAALGARACAAMKDGSARCWGRYADTSELVPTLVSGVSNASKVCVGDNRMCALGRDGAVSCMGASLKGASDLACAGHRACAIVSGKVLCWNEGEAPREAPGVVGATAIVMGGALGSVTACATLGDATLRCWGAGKRGQLGNGTFEDADEPQIVAGLHVKNVCIGGEHTCAVLDDETIACFGSDDDGELGDGRSEQTATPRKTQNVNIAQQVSCGAHHTCARMGDSTVHCWGKNDVHQAGIGSAPQISTPTLVPGLYESTAVVCGDDFTCVRMQDGWLRCFGVNDWGQLADGTHEIRNVPNPIQY